MGFSEKAIGPFSKSEYRDLPGEESTDGLACRSVKEHRKIIVVTQNEIFIVDMSCAVVREAELPAHMFTWRPQEKSYFINCNA